LFFIVNSQKQNNDDGQGAKDIESCHNFCSSRHKNYFLINETLEYHAKIEKSKPKDKSEISTDPVTSGPINMEAKNTCPMSRRISENTFVFSK
jgi:hypothetical protein